MHIMGLERPGMVSARVVASKFVITHVTVAGPGHSYT